MATAKCVMVTVVTTSGALMGYTVVSLGLPWVVIPGITFRVFSPMLNVCNIYFINDSGFKIYESETFDGMTLKNDFRRFDMPVVQTIKLDCYAFLKN